MTRLLGLDVGTSSVKGIAIDGDGAVLAVAERGYPLSTPRPGWSEQDPEDWWRAARPRCSRSSTPPSAAGIGLSGQMHGLVALDAGRAAAAARDPVERRAHAGAVRRDRGAHRLRAAVALTGNRALAGFTAPKLLAGRHEPDVYGRIRHILLPKDYVRLKPEASTPSTSPTRAGTLLFDVARRWSDEVVNCAGGCACGIARHPQEVDDEIGGAGDQGGGAAVGVDARGSHSARIASLNVEQQRPRRVGDVDRALAAERRRT